MSYDVNTISELVDLLGGPSGLGEKLGIGDNAICNWAARDFIPPSWHTALIVELRLRGKVPHPDIFELTEQQFRVLFDRPVPRPKARGVARGETQKSAA